MKIPGLCRHDRRSCTIAGLVGNPSLDPQDRVQPINHCGDTYKVATDGKVRDFWERNLRFKTDVSDDGPQKGAGPRGSRYDGRPSRRHLRLARGDQRVYCERVLINRKAAHLRTAFRRDDRGKFGVSGVAAAYGAVCRELHSLAANVRIYKYAGPRPSLA